MPLKLVWSDEDHPPTGGASMVFAPRTPAKLPERAPTSPDRAAGAPFDVWAWMDSPAGKSELGQAVKAEAVKRCTWTGQSIAAAVAAVLAEIEDPDRTRRSYCSECPLSFPDPRGLILHILSAPTYH